jgi:hypothetical protein
MICRSSASSATGSRAGATSAGVATIRRPCLATHTSSNEVGAHYERRGQAKPVSALTGLSYVPGIFLFFIGPIVWFVKRNGALNAYWRSLGAR